MVFNTPNISAIIFRFPLNNLSENQPENTVPITPNKALIEIIPVAVVNENPLDSCRNNTPQLFIAYRLTYIKELDNASIHT